MIWCILILLGFLAHAEIGLAQEVVRIPVDATVEGTQITLGEIALLDGLPPERQRVLSAFSLGSAAPPAKFRTFSGSGLRTQLAARAPDTVLDIPDQFRVHTAYREIRADYLHDRLEQAIRSRMPWPASAVTFSGWSLPEDFAVPIHAQRLLVHFRAEEDFLGRLTARMQLIDSERPDVGSTQRGASVEISVRVPVVVAARKIRRGELLDADSIKLETRDLRGTAKSALTELSEATGQTLRRGVRNDQVITRSHLEVEAVVRRGDPITIQAGHPGLDLRIDARALEQGATGQMIRVENPSTRHRFFAIVDGPASATLSLPGVGGR